MSLGHLRHLWRRSQGLHVFSQGLAKCSFSCVVDGASILDLVDDVWNLAVERLAQASPERDHRRQRQRIQQTGLDRQDQRHLVGKPQGCMLRLLQNRADSRAARQLMRGPVCRACRRSG